MFNLPDKAAAMLRADLAAAGIAYASDEGYADFHSLRASYVTMLVKGGASVKVAQTLARHSDPKLTLNTYTRLGIHDYANALDTLPDLAPTARPAVAVATGTPDARPVRATAQRAAQAQRRRSAQPAFHVPRRPGLAQRLTRPRSVSLAQPMD